MQQTYYEQNDLVSTYAFYGKYMNELGKMYIGPVHYYISTGEVFTGSLPSIYAEPLYEINEAVDFRNPQEYLYYKSSKPIKQKQNNPISFYNYVTPYAYFILNDYKRGYGNRYFCKQFNSQIIYEITFIGFNALRRESIYELFSITWKLTGPKNDIIKNNIKITPGVYDTNLNIMNDISKKYIHFTKLINNPLQLSIYDNDMCPQEIINSFR